MYHVPGWGEADSDPAKSFSFHVDVKIAIVANIDVDPNVSCAVCQVAVGWGAEDEPIFLRRPLLPTRVAWESADLNIESLPGTEWTLHKIPHAMKETSAKTRTAPLCTLYTQVLSAKTVCGFYTRYHTRAIVFC